MIKVLQLTRNLGIGGLEKVIYDICKGADTSKFAMSVCCMHFKGEFGEDLEKMGMQVQVLPAPKQVDYFNFLKVAQVIQSIQPDILHTHNSHAFIDGTLASFLAKKSKIINTDHARNYPDKKRILISERLCAVFAKKIVAVSDHTKNELAEYSRIPYRKIRIIYNGIDASKYAIEIDKEAKLYELGIQKYRPIIGLGVRLTRQKGIDYLLAAMPGLIAEFPEIILLIAGKGELEPELRLRTEQLGIKENVRFLGARLDWNEILQILDVYVLPSVWEGLPLALLEAMAACKPIVATSVGGVPSVVAHYEHGLLVPKEDPKGLGDGILTLLRDSALSDRLSRNARNRFLERYTVDRMVAGYERLYRELMDDEG